MTDQPSTPPNDPTAPSPDVPPPPSAPPAFDPPASQPSYAAPSADVPPPPPPTPGSPESQSTYAAPPPTNPYGGYTHAPTMGSQGGGQVAVGSLPYVEHHFGRVASFGDRILPSIVDGLLMMIGFVPTIIGFIIIIADSASTGEWDQYGNYQSGDPNGAALGFGMLLIGLGFLTFIAVWIWNRILRMGRTGQSVGKKLFGLKLINATTGEPIGAGQAFIREVIHGLANQVFYLSYLWMLWDPNRQTLGDLVAKSTVIQVPKS